MICNLVFIGLEKVSSECKALNIKFHLLKGSGPELLPLWVEKNKIGAVVCDFEPLKVPLKMVEHLKENLKMDVPLIRVKKKQVNKDTKFSVIKPNLAF